MSLSGPVALSSLEEALRDIRREEDEIARRLARSSDVIAKYREAEGELFRQLAGVRLEPAAQAELSGRISAAEQRAREMLKQHAGNLSATEEKLRTIDARITAVVAERAQQLAEVERRQGELKALSSAIAASAARDPTYAGKRDAVTELQQVAAESLRKTEQAEADRENKGKPYRDDPLFTYLWSRNYGTDQYRAGNLTRMLDGWVARLIDYGRARPNYAMLNEIPVRLREHAEQQAARAEAGLIELADMENRAIDAAGGKPIRDALDRASEGIARHDTELLALEDERDETAKSLNVLAQGNDPDFAEALSSLAQSLGRQELATLLAEARRTGTGQDDSLVAQIDENRARAREEVTQIMEQKERLKTLTARRRELEDISYEFRKARYDDPRSSFREDNLVGDLLNDFLRGGISAAAYWDHWRGSQGFRTGPTEWGGGINLPGNTPWSPGGGGFSWPGNSSGGGSGGGFGGSNGGGFSWPKSGSGGGGFSRPRSGSSGTRKHGGFTTGGGF